MDKKSGFIPVLIAHIKHFIKKSSRDNIPALSGSSTLFILLSAIPLLLFVFSVFSIMTGKDISSIKLNNLSALSDEQSALFYELFEYIKNSIQSSGSGTTIIAVVVALWSAGKGIYCVSEGVARIYQIPSKKFWLFKRVFAMGYTLVMILLVLLCILMVLLDSVVIGYIIYLLNAAWIKWVLILISYIAFSILIALLLSLSAKLYLSNKVKNKSYTSIRALFPGMMFTVIAWHVLNLGVIIYLRNFAVSSVYGSLGSVFVIMIWIYFMINILLYGVQLDYIYRGEFCRKGWMKRLAASIRSYKQK